LAGRAASRRKNAVLRKTSRKPKRDKHGTPRGIPMSQATFVAVHRLDGDLTR
jgi:hypothetical protein